MTGVTPLSILDLSPVVEGSDPREAIAHTLDLARRAEEFGYHRYWLAEHHFAPGVASSAPAVLIGAVAAATRRIRVGSGAVQLGHQTPLSVVEQFGTLDALHPGRIDLGLGRSGQRVIESRLQPETPEQEERIVDGLLIPKPFSFAQLLTDGSRLAKLTTLLQQPGAQTPDFAEQVAQIQAFLSGQFTVDGEPLDAVPGKGAAVQLWILGSSGGQSARLAGALGLPFAANYHVAPSAVLEAVQGYRAAFRPSAVLARPYVIVSVDVVAADDEATARRLASPYGLWVRGIRAGGGAIPFPSEEQAAAHVWSDEDRALVDDRVRTQFVGDPETVAGKLRVLRDVTGADELLLTTITHRHEDRVRSYELIAKAWGEPGTYAAGAS
jgi:alkanesulfonate monooxygenase SsuD/methylene tetrahydromethanopterin reductase-like flavin-dependent oxidoreductase (luciferase family)